MKTVVIVHHTGTWGGGTKSLIDLCQMLHSKFNIIVCLPKGYTSFVLYLNSKGYMVYETKMGVPFLNIYSGSPGLISRSMIKSAMSIINIKAFCREVINLRPNIVIFNSIVTAVSSNFFPNDIKTVCIDRETMTNRLSIWIYEHILKNINAVLFLSEYERQKFHFENCITSVFPDCVQFQSKEQAQAEESVHQENLDSDKFIVLYMGGFSKIKGTDVILSAMDRLDDHYLLIMAGNTDLNDNGWIYDLQHPKYAWFMWKTRLLFRKLYKKGKLYNAGLCKSIDSLIKYCNIVVFPSTSVHQPRPCIEAGLYKKPVIISDYNETKEYFIDGYNALTFQAGNFKELAQKIQYAASHCDDIKRMGINNFEITKRKHNFDDCKKFIINLLNYI